MIQDKYFQCHGSILPFLVLCILLVPGAVFYPLHAQASQKPGVPDIINAPYYPEWEESDIEQIADADKPSFKMLQQACRLLASGDTLGFEKSYAEALSEAEKEDNFARIFQEAEFIFTPWERLKWDKLENPAERSEFFRIFWKVRDPDPISPHNDRLVMHYIQLLEEGLLSAPGGLSWVKSQMRSGSFTDPLPALRHDYYGADFLSPDGRLEVEFYHSAPVKAASQEKSPEAAFAFYDSNWVELARDSISARKIAAGSDSIWFAMHRVFSDPGKYYYALRMDIPGHRAANRNIIRLKSYPKDQLNLSGVVLGTPPSPGDQAHSRRGVDILPRPSLIFASGETIMVYFEIYGLGKDSEGMRAFREQVTVSLVKDREIEQASPSFSGNIEELMNWEGNLLSSLTLSFDRETPEQTGPVAENFIIDTTELLPGHYRLFLHVSDNSSKEEQEVTWYFNLTPRNGK